MRCGSVNPVNKVAWEKKNVLLLMLVSLRKLWTQDVDRR